MTDYSELVKALRYCAESGDFKCGKDCTMHTEYPNCLTKMDTDAADAIEELQDEVFELEEELNDADVAADDNERQIEELQAEVKQAAKRNAELHAELDRWVSAAEKAGEPKLGECQKAKPHGVVTYSDGYAECSHCHEAIWLGWGMNFCPNCGTQNKIIDPDDYDGAKMEVQE